MNVPYPAMQRRRMQEPAEALITPVTIALGVVALLALLGLVMVWSAVIRAWIS